MALDPIARAQSVNGDATGTSAGSSASSSAGPSAGPQAKPFFRVGISQTAFPGSIPEAQESFRLFRALHVESILEPSLLKTVMDLCASGHFGPGSRNAPGFREMETPQRAGRVLNLALNRPELLRWLEEVTHCEPLASIEGRVAQTLAHRGDQLYWHDDFLESEGRRLAIVINLSTEPYEGGEFGLRPKGGEIIFEHRYTEAGSALIFEVDRTLEHRVKPLSSGGPRRVFAGWAMRALEA